MFGGAKLVVLRDADEFISRFREQMENYVGSPSESTILVLRCKSLPSNQRIYKLIAKVGQIIRCEPPKQDALAGWIMRHAKDAHGLTVPIDAANQLADLIGVDLGKLDSEIGKLALMATGGKITADAISHTVAFQREQDIWKLTDMLSSGNIKATIQLWRQLLQTDPSSEFRAATWLTIWLERLTRVRLMSEKKVPAFVIGKELRIWTPGQVDSMLRMSNRLGADGIRCALDRLAQADRRGKSGLGEAATNIESFLLSLAN
jgi:DNA polymerase-3 subunit delta